MVKAFYLFIIYLFFLRNDLKIIYIMLIYSATYFQIVQYIGQFILSHIYGYTGKLINSFNSPFFLTYLFDSPSMAMVCMLKVLL